MPVAQSRADRLLRMRRIVYWLTLPLCLVLWAYLRFQLSWPPAVDALVLIALFAEAALVLGRPHHAR
jgi:hypothetical protein